jgi:hypothetical protein
MEKNKLFIFISVILILIQIFFTYKGIENTPFFHYGMFSEPTKKQEKIYYVKIDNQEIPLSKNHGYNREVLLYNLENYELAIAGDTQVNQVIHQRLDRFHDAQKTNYFVTNLSNHLHKAVYQKWICKYVQQEFSSSKKIEIGYYLLDENTTILSTKILMSDERN